jgi:hypothetical protein
MRNAPVLLVIAAVALGACHKDSDQQPAGKPAPRPTAPVAAKKGPTPEQQTVGMVQAVSQEKSQLPVVLKFDLLQVPAMGKPVDIEIAMVPQISAQGASIQVSGSDGVDVFPDSRQLDLQAVEAGQVYRRKISVTAAAAGVFFVTLTVTLKHDEIVESRAFSVPMIVDST